MGLIQAALSAAGSVIQDQWKEYFYCDALDKNVLVAKGVKKTSGFSANAYGRDNIITSGSGIAIADGQCMIIVEDGKIVEFCAEPGNFIWDASSEPSIFNGDLKDSIKETFAKIGARFTMVIGDNELENGEAVLKNMKTGEKITMKLGEDFVDHFFDIEIADRLAAEET